MQALTMHTFNTDHVFVESFSDYFGWSADGERAAIWQNLGILTKQLEGMGINYDAFRNALVPRQDKREVCLMFDSLILERGHGNYATGASEFVVPLLSKDLTTSILHGDLISRNQSGDLAYLRRTYPHLNLAGLIGTSQIYCVYITNLSPRSLDKIVGGLAGTPGFVGAVDTTSQSLLKDRLSGVLVPVLLKVRSTYILQHSDTVEPQHGLDEGTWAVGSSRIVSVYDLLFGQYLSYKIQRSSGGAFSRNEALMLTSLDATYARASDSKIGVIIAKEKFDYLTTKKQSNLQNMGKGDINAGELCALVYERIRDHYLFGLRILENGDLLCSTLVEVDRGERSPYRAEIGLRLVSDENAFYITTLY